MTLDEMRQRSGTTDEDGVVWPTSAALATAERLAISTRGAMVDGDGGIVFRRRIGRATVVEIHVDSGGAAGVLLFVDSRLVYRLDLSTVTRLDDADDGWQDDY